MAKFETNKMNPKTYILKRLKEIEKEYAVKILYAVESGSRAWGFASVDSDYDIRFLYAHKPQWYISVLSKPDTINVMEKEKVFDFAGWDIKKTAALLLKSNMSLYEWFNSPIIYKNSKQINSLKLLSKKFLDKKKLMFSYIALANNNYNVYITKNRTVKAKKYLYILRTIAACIWLEKKNSLPPITIDKLSELLKEDNIMIYNFLQTIVKGKKLGSEKTISKSPMRINKWIESKIKYYFLFAKKIQNNDDVNTQILDNFLYETINKILPI